MNKEKLKKVGEIASNVLLYLFLAICLASLALTIFAKKDPDGTAIVFGHQLRIVTTGSMEKCELTDVSDFEIKSIPVRSLVFVEMVPEDEAEKAAWYDDLNEGDVLTFKYDYHKQVTITHRIVDIEPKGDGYIITLEGDNKNSEDNQGQQKIDTTNEFSPKYVVGKVVGQSIILGFILSIMKEPVGLIFAVIVPCAIVIVMEVVKIVSVLNEEKKKKAEEESQKKDDELEELRRKLAQLENMQTGAAAPKTEEPKVEKIAEEPKVEAEKEESDVAVEEVKAEKTAEDECDTSPTVEDNSTSPTDESVESAEETTEENATQDECDTSPTVEDDSTSQTVEDDSTSPTEESIDAVEEVKEENATQDECDTSPTVEDDSTAPIEEGIDAVEESEPHTDTEISLSDNSDTETSLSE